VDGPQTTAALIVLIFVFALMGYVAVSVALFRIRHRHLTVPKDPSPRDHSFLLHYLFRQWWYHWARPIVGFLIRHRWHPDGLTYLSLVFAAASAVLFATSQLAYAGFFLLLSGACDSLDGRLARETSRASARGAFLDSTLDRAGEILVFSGIVVFLRASPFLYAALVGLGAGVMVSYARARGHSLGVDFNRGFMQRPERVVYLAGGAILDPVVRWQVGLGVLDELGGFFALVVTLVAVLSLATAVYRVAMIARRLDRVDREEPGRAGR